LIWKLALTALACILGLALGLMAGGLFYWLVWQP